MCITLKYLLLYCLHRYNILFLIYWMNLLNAFITITWNCWLHLFPKSFTMWFIYYIMYNILNIIWNYACLALNVLSISLHWCIYFYLKVFVWGVSTKCPITVTFFCHMHSRDIICIQQDCSTMVNAFFFYINNQSTFKYYPKRVLSQTISVLSTR